MNIYKNDGIRVVLWTGNDEEDYREMTALQPYGVIVDDVKHFEAWRDSADLARDEPASPGVIRSLDRDSVEALSICAAYLCGARLTGRCSAARRSKSPDQQ